MSEIKSISVNNVKQTIEVKESILNGRIVKIGDLLLKYFLLFSGIILLFLVGLEIFFAALGKKSLSFGDIIYAIFTFFGGIYGLIEATAGFGKGLVFIGDGYVAFPDYLSQIDSNGEAYNYLILKKGEFDLDYRLKKKRWEVRYRKDTIFITEETAYAICKYVLQSEDLCEYKKKEGKEGSRQHPLRHLM